MKVLEYKILQGSQGEIEEIINEYIRYGWQPYGNLVLKPTAIETYFVQAVVRYPKEKRVNLGPL